MSIEKKKIITCPDCGNDGEFVIWESLNTELDPQAQADLLSGRLFTYTCPHCKSVNTVNYGMLYHQMKKHIMIEYVPDNEDTMEVVDYFEKITSGELLELPRLQDDYKFRIVHSQNQLREKAYIFEQDLDDRIIELMKIIIIAQIGKSNVDFEIREILLAPDEEGPKNFVILLSDGRFIGTSFALELYKALENDLIDPADGGLKEYIVDSNWAINRLQMKK